MTLSMLLKSWAMPPAMRPIESSFCAWASSVSSRLRWVMSRANTSEPGLFRYVIGVA